MSVSLAALTLGGLFGPSRGLMRRLLPRPGRGPSREEREAGFFEILLIGRSDGEPPMRVRAVVRGESDPGYGETSKMLAESALCLACDELPSRGGVLTPASCMGGPLLARLRAAGMTFDVGPWPAD